MTEREIILQTALLEYMVEQARPRREALLHVGVQTGLGATFTATEIGAALMGLAKKQRASGLPDGDSELKWSITDAGRHYLANR